jgi:hypothetical protein
MQMSVQEHPPSPPASTNQVQLVPCSIPGWYNGTNRPNIYNCYALPGKNNKQYLFLIIRHSTIYRRKIVRMVFGGYDSEDSGPDDDPEKFVNVQCFHYHLKVVRLNDSGSEYTSLSCPITRKNGLLGKTKTDNFQFAHAKIFVEDIYSRPSLTPEISSIDEITRPSDYRACRFKFLIHLILPDTETHVFSMHSSEKTRKQKNMCTKTSSFGHRLRPQYHPLQYASLTKIARTARTNQIKKFTRLVRKYIIHRIQLYDE